MPISSVSFLIIYFAILQTVHSKVCKSARVANTPEALLYYKDCRVIEGDLQVVLIEQPNDVTDYYNKSFSELYEITDYLIVYRVGLPSLNVIFPKLTSIKGEKLFFGHALVLYDLPDLEEIGLVNLRNIGGGLMIDRCPKLCYVDTINWTGMGTSNVTFYRSSFCPDQACPRHCQGYCWNNFECQDFKKSHCDPLCVGCAQNYSPKHCHVCKYFNDSGTCVRTCPEPKLVDHSDRCIYPKDCISRNGTRSIFKNTCVQECPKWFQRDSFGMCIPSDIKVCEGRKITDYHDFEQMVGCTHINGSLEIALSRYVSTPGLERSFGMVVSISQFLKIVRSNSITTLEFFKRLRTIKGEKLWSGKYSLFVAQNQNLQKLWDFNTTVIIEKGEAIFQDNPHLCSTEFNKITTIGSNNGWQTVCNLNNLNVTIVERHPTNVTLSWVSPQKNTTAIGYTVYFKPHTGDVFQVKDGYVNDNGVPPWNDWSNSFVRNNTVVLRGLYPSMWYTYYIKTNFLSIQNQQTPIYYFKTAEGDVEPSREPQIDPCLLFCANNKRK